MWLHDEVGDCSLVGEWGVVGFGGVDRASYTLVTNRSVDTHGSCVNLFVASSESTS